MQKKNIRPEDLTFTKLKKGSERDILKALEQQSKSAELDVVNSMELLSSDKRDDKLYDHYSYCLWRLRKAQREIQCKLKATNNKK
jgi:hypothetical protein